MYFQLLADSIVFVVEADSIQEITPNKKETEVVDYLIQEINSRLNPGLPSNITVPENLRIIIDRDISESVIEVRKVKEILKDVFVNTYKDQVFLVEDTEAKVNDYFGDEWLVEIGKEDTVETFNSELFTLSQRELNKRNLIEEVQSITDEDIQSLQEIGVFREEIEPIPIVNPLDAIAQAAECILSMSGQPNNDPDPTILSVKIIGPEIVTKENSAFPLKVQVNGSMGQYTVMATAGANTTAEQTYSTDTTAVLNGLISPQKGQSQEIKVEVTDIAGSTVTTIANVTVPDVMIKIPQFVPINGQAPEGQKNHAIEFDVLPSGTIVPVTIMSNSLGNIMISDDSLQTTTEYPAIFTANNTPDEAAFASEITVSFDNSNNEKIYSPDNNYTITNKQLTVFEATSDVVLLSKNPADTPGDKTEFKHELHYVLTDAENHPGEVSHEVSKLANVAINTIPQNLEVEFSGEFLLEHNFLSNNIAIAGFMSDSFEPEKDVSELQSLSITWNGEPIVTPTSFFKDYPHHTFPEKSEGVVTSATQELEDYAQCNSLINNIFLCTIKLILEKIDLLSLKSKLENEDIILIKEIENDIKPYELHINPIRLPLNYANGTGNNELEVKPTIKLFQKENTYVFGLHGLNTLTTNSSNTVVAGLDDFNYSIANILVKENQTNE